MFFLHFFTGSALAFVFTMFFPRVTSSIYFFPDNPAVTPTINYKTFEDKSGKVNIRTYTYLINDINFLPKYY